MGLRRFLLLPARWGKRRAPTCAGVIMLFQLCTRGALASVCIVFSPKYRGPGKFVLTAFRAILQHRSNVSSTEAIFEQCLHLFLEAILRYRAVPCRTLLENK